MYQGFGQQAVLAGVLFCQSSSHERAVGYGVERSKVDDDEEVRGIERGKAEDHEDVSGTERGKAEDNEDVPATERGKVEDHEDWSGMDEDGSGMERGKVEDHEDGSGMEWRRFQRFTRSELFHPVAFQEESACQEESEEPEVRQEESEEPEAFHAESASRRSCHCCTCLHRRSQRLNSMDESDIERDTHKKEVKVDKNLGNKCLRWQNKTREQVEHSTCNEKVSEVRAYSGNPQRLMALLLLRVGQTPCTLRGGRQNEECVKHSKQRRCQSYISPIHSFHALQVFKGPACATQALSSPDTCPTTRAGMSEICTSQSVTS